MSDNNQDNFTIYNNDYKSKYVVTFKGKLFYLLDGHVWASYYLDDRNTFDTEVQATQELNKIQAKDVHLSEILTVAKIV